MSTFNKKLITVLCWAAMALCAYVALVAPAHAQQNTLFTTTLSGAVTSSASYITLASSTNVTVPTQGANGSFLYIDREMFQVVAASPPGTTTNQQFLVVRGVNGTKASAHASGQIVWIGFGDWFSNDAAGTSQPQGSCVIANVYASPSIHVQDGTFWTCDSTKLWGYAGPNIGEYGARNAITQVSATYAATYYDSIIEATANSFTITLPAAAAMPGKVYILSNTSSGTITVTTAHGCASYTTGGCTVYSNGTVWQTF